MSDREFDRLDAAAHVLRWVTALMPAHRSEWSRGMRAELHHISGRPARWSFVLGCGWTALRIRALEGNTMTSYRELAARTAVVACLMVVPFIGLEGASAGVAALWTTDAAMLFGVLWLLAAVALTMGSGLVSVFDGERFRGRQGLVLLRVLVLVLASAAWLGIVGDQMPCFVGEPNCD
jgi:hypothetical protein